jgi:hypothetical protein
VIPIDDLDLNITGAYVMSECIRKYLINKHCVVVVSLRIEQLIEAISSHVKRQTPDLSSDEISTKSVKYVTKLLPIGSRIVMPSFENYFESELVVKGDGKDIHFRSVQEAVVKLVFRKTGYLFYNSKGGSSLLIPRNLRSLRHLIHLLISMSDHDKSNTDMLHENQRVFKDYFFHTWTLQLNEKYRDRTMDLLNVNNDISFNKVVVSQLADEFDKNDMEDVVKSILNPDNYAYNISLGDVFFLIDRLRQHVSDSQLQLYLFFISTLYSMKLYEAYDEVTEKLDSNPEDEEQENQDSVKAEIYASDSLFNDVNQMQRLVNGGFFTYQNDKILPPMKVGVKSRDFTLLNGGILGSKLKKLVGELEKADELTEEQQKEFRMLEFFMLTTSHYAILK